MAACWALVYPVPVHFPSVPDELMEKHPCIESMLLVSKVSKFHASGNLRPMGRLASQVYFSKTADKTQ